jgi:hypothetical protein
LGCIFDNLANLSPHCALKGGFGIHYINVRKGLLLPLREMLGTSSPESSSQRDKGAGLALLITIYCNKKHNCSVTIENSLQSYHSKSLLNGLTKRGKKIFQKMSTWRLRASSGEGSCCGSGGTSWRGSGCELHTSGKSYGKVNVARRSSFLLDLRGE